MSIATFKKIDDGQYKVIDPNGDERAPIFPDKSTAVESAVNAGFPVSIMDMMPDRD